MGGAMPSAGEIAAGMDVYDERERYIGVVTRVYPAPARFLSGASGAGFGCFKVRRGPLPLFGPKPLLVPFDAVRAVDREGQALMVGATREEAGQWAVGRQG